MLLALATIIPFSAVADVENSKGSKYRVETCFVSADQLDTRFIYPDRSTTFAVREGRVSVVETGKPGHVGNDNELRLAFGHHFHAIAWNAGGWAHGPTHSLPHGGEMVVLARKNGIPSRMRFDLPGTTPIELAFGDWRAGTPYRLRLTHDGVSYDYRYRSVKRRCRLG